MAATTAERVVYASKSRKWNSRQCLKFATEFPVEHAGNIEWIRKADEELARRRIEEEARAKETEAARKEEARGRGTIKAKGDGRGKWIVVGIIGILVAMRGWQRWKENAL